MNSQQSQLPSVMSAIFYDHYGDYSVLKKKSDFPVPALSDVKNTLIQVNFTSFNPVDYKIRSGYLKLFYRAMFPQIIGQDFSGIVVQSLDGAKFKQGDRVAGMLENQGACAEYVACGDRALAPVPEEMSLAEAACLPTVALATYETMIKIGGLKPLSTTTTTTSESEPNTTSRKPKILILGGSGGVGSFAVQYAKHVLGAEVHATCSSVNVSYVKSLGADYVYDYSSDTHFEKLIPKNLDIVMDNVGGEMYQKTWSLLNNRGKYVFVGVGNEPMTYMQGSSTGAKLVWRKVTSFLRLSPSYHVVATRANGSSLAQVISDYMAAKMSPGYITRAYAFSEDNAKIAHRLMETRRTRGKILMQVAQNLPPREAALSQSFLNRFGHNIVGWNAPKVPPIPTFQNSWITSASRN